MSNLPAVLPLSLLLVACVGQPDAYVETETPDPISEGDLDGDDGGNDDVGTPDPDPKPLFPPASGAAFIFAHGFSGNGDSFSLEISAALESEGHAVLRATLPPVEGVAARGATLGFQVDQVIAETGVAKVHVIAHSQGGLDARYMVSSLGYADRVASLTTISTPHQGTPLADLALGVVGESGDQSIALDLFEALAGDVDEAALNRALVDLSERQASAFNTANPDQVGVYYQSFAGLSTVFGASTGDADTACLTQPVVVIPDPDTLAAPLVLAAPIVAKVPDERLAHDGVVSVASAKHAVFRGCIPADHFDEVLATPDSRYDAVSFYRNIAAELAAP
jgi:triacylglycerol lipase